MVIGLRVMAKFDGNLKAKLDTLCCCLIRGLFSKQIKVHIWCLKLIKLYLFLQPWSNHAKSQQICKKVSNPGLINPFRKCQRKKFPKPSRNLKWSTWKTTTTTKHKNMSKLTQSSSIFSAFHLTFFISLMLIHYSTWNFYFPRNQLLKMGTLKSVC